MIWKNGLKVEETEEERHERWGNRRINPCAMCADDCWNLDGADDEDHWRECPVSRAVDRGEW